MLPSDLRRVVARSRTIGNVTVSKLGGSVKA
jgi:hypothetical protein